MTNLISKSSAISCLVLALFGAGCNSEYKGAGGTDRPSDSTAEEDSATVVFDGTADETDTGRNTDPGTETDSSKDAGGDAVDSEQPAVFADYGVLSTIAGTCLISDKDVNGWREEFEGGPAIDAELSRPHFAMTDEAGNIFIADKDADGVRRISAEDGTIATVAGTNEPGDDGDGPGKGTEMRLSSPNGLFVFKDGTVFILDLGNSKIRRLDVHGEMTTLFTDPSSIGIGRGLWVREDEALVYYASGASVRQWTPENGVETVVDGFSDLGNLTVDPNGNLVVTDRGAGRVYRIDDAREVSAIAGNGTASGGGDGMPALDTGLSGVRGVWFLENGDYFLATHEGSQVWYVDPNGIIHLFLGGAHDAHGGDGEPFDTPGVKVSEPRAVSVSSNGDVIITENDCGYIRKVSFLGAL